MPLEFHSISHGRIAFGFFNIETDLLLLEKYFFFAHGFCSMVDEIAAKQSHESNEIGLVGYFIDRHEDIGNLMGAIHGIDLRGSSDNSINFSRLPRVLRNSSRNRVERQIGVW